MRLDYAIVFVRDMTRAVSFYRDVLELPLRFESPEWTEFATEGATLALHRSDLDATPGTDAAALPAGRCRPGLSVPDLDAFHQRMLDHEVVCVQAPQDLHGTRLAQYVDPDGLGLSVSEQRPG